MSYLKNTSSVGFYLHLFLYCFLLSVESGQAQVLPGLDTAKQQAAVAAQDSLGRGTPRGTVEGFISAVADENYDRAALYLKKTKSRKNKQIRVQQARALQQLLDESGQIVPYSLLSDNPQGNNDDNLNANLEKIGTASLNGEQFNIILEQVEEPDGSFIWVFSSETIQRIPAITKKAPAVQLIDKFSPDFLKDHKWGGVPAGHWLAALVLIAIAYLIAWSITKLFMLALPLVWLKARTEPTSIVIKAFSLPVRLYLTVWFFIILSQEAGISIILRQRFSFLTVVVGIVAVLLLIWQLLDFGSRFLQNRMARRENQAGVSAILFARRAAKVTLIFLGVILILDTLGVDVTTGLAALGIGGIALALGAQKTMENFVGSVTLIADQPVRVGDYCKVGDIAGTVEQIGMRSTRIRTNDRTIVTIPNGDFSSQKIENFAFRDRFWFHPTFTLRPETSPDQIRYLLVELRAILYAHPKVSPDPARIRFVELSSTGYKLEVFSYVLALNFDEFIEVQEDLFLRMMDVIADSGTGLALPSQTLYLRRDELLSEEKAKAAEDKVKKWRNDNDIQLPNFSTERIKNLRSTIPYPPEGSNQNKKK